MQKINNKEFFAYVLRNNIRLNRNASKKKTRQRKTLEDRFKMYDFIDTENKHILTLEKISEKYIIGYEYPIVLDANSFHIIGTYDKEQKKVYTLDKPIPYKQIKDFIMSLNNNDT